MHHPASYQFATRFLFRDMLINTVHISSPVSSAVKAVSASQPLAPPNKTLLSTCDNIPVRSDTRRLPSLNYIHAPHNYVSVNDGPHIHDGGPTRI